MTRTPDATLVASPSTNAIILAVSLTGVSPSPHLARALVVPPLIDVGNAIIAVSFTDGGIVIISLSYFPPLRRRPPMRAPSFWWLTDAGTVILAVSLLTRVSPPSRLVPLTCRPHCAEIHQCGHRHPDTVILAVIVVDEGIAIISPCPAHVPP